MNVKITKGAYLKCYSICEKETRRVSIIITFVYLFILIIREVFEITSKSKILVFVNAADWMKPV